MTVLDPRRMSDREMFVAILRPSIAKPGWRNRWAHVKAIAAEALTLIGLIAVLMFVFIAATIGEAPR